MPKREGGDEVADREAVRREMCGAQCAGPNELFARDVPKLL